MIHWNLALVGLLGCLVVACGGSNQPANDPNGSQGSAGASYGSGVPAPTGGSGTTAGAGLGSSSGGH